RFDSPFVGREAALEALASVWHRVTRSASCELVTIVGAAGLGKTRLAEEFVRRLDARAVTGRCRPYGEGITCLPLLEIMGQLQAQLAALDPEARRPLAVLAGDDGAASPDEVAWAARKLLEAAAVDGPLVALFDDIQWAAPSLLELLEQLALLSTGRPLL